MSWRSRWRWALVASVVVGAAFGCNALFGISDYSVNDADGGVDPGDGSPEGANGEGGCEGEGGCFACPPTENIEYLNACTNATCVPFDDEERVPGFNADGSLPPVPDLPSDGG